MTFLNVALDFQARSLERNAMSYESRGYDRPRYEGSP